MTAAAVATDTTDDNGYYEFTGLKAGKYLVAEDCRAGWIQLDPKPHSDTEADCGTGIHPITVTSGFSDKNNNFINFELGTKGGYKYSDLDGDLTTTGDRTALKLWTINLFKDVRRPASWTPVTAAAIATDTTDDQRVLRVHRAEGRQVPGGRGLQGGLDPVGPDAPSNTEADCGTGIHPITVTSGFSDKNNNFINFELGTKGGYKYSDLNGDGKVIGRHLTGRSTCKDVNGDKLDADDGACEHR